MVHQDGVGAFAQSLTLPGGAPALLAHQCRGESTLDTRAVLLRLGQWRCRRGCRSCCSQGEGQIRAVALLGAWRHPGAWCGAAAGAAGAGRCVAGGAAGARSAVLAHVGAAAPPNAPSSQHGCAQGDLETGGKVVVIVILVVVVIIVAFFQFMCCCGRGTGCFVNCCGC